MTFNRCKEWSAEFGDVMGIEIEHVKLNDFDKLTDVICVWEVLRLMSKSDVNVENLIKFLSSLKVVSGRVGREFDQCIERGITKANVLFNDLIEISSILKNYYVINTNITGKVKQEVFKYNKNIHTKNPLTFKINRPLRRDITISTNNTNGNDEKIEENSDLKVQNGNCNGYKIGKTKLEYVKRIIPFALVKNFIILHLLNEGSVGKVYLAIDYKRKFYAVKIISKIDNDYHSFNKIKDELIIASKLKHENIVETYLIMETKYNLLLFMEYCSGGDLITFIRRNGNIQEETVKSAFKMIISSIKYLHENNIYHRDIKPENIFLTITNSNKAFNNIQNVVEVAEVAKHFNGYNNEIAGNIKDYKNGSLCNSLNINKDLSNYTLKLGDFGASIRNKKDVRLFETVGTMSYAAPEVLDGVSGYLGEKADIWSMGVVLYAMLFGQLPYTTPEDTVKTILNKILNTKLKFPNKKISKEVKDLISLMLEINPYKRITLNQLCNHEWITGKKIKSNEMEGGNVSMGGCVVRDIDNGLNVIMDEMI